MDSTKESISADYTNYKAIGYVFDHSKATGSALLVLLALARHANDAGVAWPSVRRLQEKTRLSRRSVMRALRALERAGEIVTLPNAGKNGVNRYRLTRMIGMRAGTRVADEAVREEAAVGGVNLTPEAARGDVNLTYEGEGARGRQNAPRSGEAESTPGRVNLSRGGASLTPEYNKEQNKKTSSSPDPSCGKAVVAAGEEEEVLDSSLKERALRSTLGAGLFSQLETLYTENAPRSRFVIWLETALYPQLERLGARAFRDAVAHYLPQAAGDGIRHPSRFLMAKLSSETPRRESRVQDANPLAGLVAEVTGGPDGEGRPESDPASGAGGREKRAAEPDAAPAPAAEPAGEAQVNSGAAGTQVRSGQQRDEAPKASAAGMPASNPFTFRPVRCRYGDHTAGDACCLPKALDTLAWAVQGLQQSRLDPIEKASLTETVRVALGRVRREQQDLPHALGQLGKNQRYALEALAKMDIAVPEPGPAVGVPPVAAAGAAVYA